jgi:hypothetical protein
MDCSLDLGGRRPLPPHDEICQGVLRFPGFSGGSHLGFASPVVHSAIPELAIGESIELLVQAVHLVRGGGESRLLPMITIYGHS